MISTLRGVLIQKSQDKIEVVVGGVGFKVLIPLSTYQILPDVGETVNLSTSFQLRENSVELIGFGSEPERDVFELLISVSGVGVKLALAAMSGLKTEDLINSIMFEDKSALSSISGIGPKTAGRLILELKDKVAKIAAVASVGSRERMSQVEEAIMALEALGYSRYEARRAVETALKEIGTQHNSDTIIKEALKVNA